MATIDTTTRNACCDAAVDLLDLGSAVTYPYILLEDSGHSSLVTLNFTGATAFGSASSGVATANTIADGTASAGTIVYAYLCDQNSNKRIDCTIGLSGTDLIIAGLTLGSGDTVGCSSLTVTMPAS